MTVEAPVDPARPGRGLDFQKISWNSAESYVFCGFQLISQEKEARQMQNQEAQGIREYRRSVKDTIFAGQTHDDMR